jgi:hypothetical protein
MDAIVDLHDLLCVVQFNNEMTDDIKRKEKHEINVIRFNVLDKIS